MNTQVRTNEMLAARKLMSEPCIGRNDRYHKGNCAGCELRGEYKDYTAPNYAGWARIYVQAEQVIPARFTRAFIQELDSDNRAYAEALRDDIINHGLVLQPQ